VEQQQIDKRSSVPVYAQIADLLRDQIADGVYRPGEAIPTVAELSATFGVASMTVRHAISQLSQEGVVSREQGRGTFVQTPRLSTVRFDLDDLTRQLLDPELEEELLDVSTIKATPRIAAKLAIHKGANVTAIKRRLVRRGEPIFYHSRYVTSDSKLRLVEAEEHPSSLRGLFLGFGEGGIKNGWLTIHSSVLSEGEARALKEDVDSPAWVVEHLYYDFGGRPVIWGRFICGADRLSFSAPVGIVDEELEEKRPGR
jgi:GntR family transcriptional regulator